MVQTSMSQKIIWALVLVVIIKETKASPTEFIKKSCGSTRYPELCFTTLSVFASKIQGSPRLLAMASLSEALKTVRSTSMAVSRLSKSPRLTKREAAALTDCAEELSDTADDLHSSIAQMAQNGGSGPEFRLRMSDIQTWVSAALTDEDTCLDAFSGNAHFLTKRIINLVHMTSNALALVNLFAFSRS